MRHLIDPSAPKLVVEVVAEPVRRHPLVELGVLFALAERSAYYAWRDRRPSKHAREDQRLRVLVRESHERSKKRYGSPRVHRELRKNGVHTSRKRIVRLMQAEQLVARKRRSYKCTTMSDHDQPVAANLLDTPPSSDAARGRRRSMDCVHQIGYRNGSSTGTERLS
jgi:transposase InsO family protein